MSASRCARGAVRGASRFFSWNRIADAGITCSSGAAAFGPAAGLELVDARAAEPALRLYPYLPSVRGDLLMKTGRYDEARVEFERAAELTQNAQEGLARSLQGAL